MAASDQTVASLAYATRLLRTEPQVHFMEVSSSYRTVTDATSRRTPKNYQKESAKISTLVSIEVERAGLFVNMKSNCPNAL